EAVFPWWFPLAAPETRAGVLTCGRLTVRAGLSVAGHLSEAGRVLRDGSPADALALAHAAFPTQIDKLYVQPDLSVIAPGPLRPGIESGLLRFARAEQSGLASTYRVDAVSLETALSRGLSAADIRTFLTEHSLTGIPQPLDYLISDVESRHGSIRVAEAPAAEGLIRSIVHTAEPAQLAALLVDSGLRHLGLAQLDATSATSRFRPEQLRGALREARIPVVPAGGAEAEAPAPAPVPAAAAPATVPDPAAELVDRVLSASQGSVESDTIERTLQLAVRDRTRLRVTVSASGQERTFLLLPTGLSNGRLRGVDAAAEVERTLPLAQITAIEPPS
ncbi:helicase-associated domain-containing protein, partial [Leucobacter sp. M11]|uniref:helicase-associated domain-containing protein n=1 Tax=Leucobacter sp. M11 TaxID=2993565 RepID=UPI002D7F6D71